MENERFRLIVLHCFFILLACIQVNILLAVEIKKDKLTAKQLKALDILTRQALIKTNKADPDVIQPSDEDVKKASNIFYWLLTLGQIKKIISTLDDLSLDNVKMEVVKLFKENRRRKRENNNRWTKKIRDSRKKYIKYSTEDDKTQKKCDVKKQMANAEKVTDESATLKPNANKSTSLNTGHNNIDSYLKNDNYDDVLKEYAFLL